MHYQPKREEQLEAIGSGNRMKFAGCGLRCLRRYLCTRLAFRSQWRATLATDWPGAPQAWSTWRLNSTVKRRRRLREEMTGVN